ncbi:hypothetical protein RFI_38753 [Reticulomyxa filosa]|uniref:Transmembrane protein n=1 Tax=Reticulomyxa filosa TaxID=46433 RepID=X6LB15_RETFI|nr:hypothetical protein RFI_38753 [Reticulomyxa filosa]|eukprot:ETN98733.1 hypothetical protein RFI_38753 [Reticulomyxa filosa]
MFEAESEAAVETKEDHSFYTKKKKNILIMIDKQISNYRECKMNEKRNRVDFECEVLLKVVLLFKQKFKYFPFFFKCGNNIISFINIRLNVFLSVQIFLFSFLSMHFNKYYPIHSFSKKKKRHKTITIKERNDIFF